jgi:tryptophanyl-tRNA synthetase
MEGLLNQLNYQPMTPQDKQRIEAAAEELWDTHSVYMDDDLDSAQQFAGQSLLNERQFKKLISELATAELAHHQKERERLIGLLKELVCEGFKIANDWQQYAKENNLQ